MSKKSEYDERTYKTRYVEKFNENERLREGINLVLRNADLHTLTSGEDFYILDINLYRFLSGLYATTGKIS